MSIKRKPTTDRYTSFGGVRSTLVITNVKIERIKKETAREFDLLLSKHGGVKDAVMDKMR